MNTSVPMKKFTVDVPVPSELYAEARGRPLLKFDTDDREHLKDLLEQCTKDLNTYRAEWRKYHEAALNALDKEDTEGTSANLLQVGYYGRMVLEKLELENSLKACLIEKENSKATEISLGGAKD